MMSFADARSRVLRVFVLLFMVAGLLVPVGAAHAAGPLAQSISSREAKTFKVGKKTFSLMLYANRMEGSESFTISFTRTKGLGGGRTTSQSHTLSFSGMKGVVKLAKDLSKGSARSGKPNQLRPQAASTVRFVSTGKINRSCGGDTRTRNGKFLGKVSFNGGRLGTVAVSLKDVKAVATSSRCDGSIPTTFPCPTGAKSVAGNTAPSPDGSNVTAGATRTAGANSATVTASMSRTLNAKHSGVGASHSQFFSTMVPPKKVKIPNHLQSGSFVTPKRSFTPGPRGRVGSGSYSAFDATSDFTYDCGPKKRNKEVVQRNSRGTLKTNMVLKSDVTKHRKLKGTLLDYFSGAGRTVVRTKS